MAVPDDPDGPGLFGRGKDAWVGVVDAAHDAIAGKLDERKVAHVTTLGEQIEADLGPLVAHALGDIAAHPDTPPSLRPILTELTKPEHFTTALLVGIAVGAIIAPVLGAATAPEIQAIANVAWHDATVDNLNQNTVHISPVEAAAAVLKGVLSHDHAAMLASFSGTNGDDFDHLVQIAGQSIGAAEALLLWRRGQIDDAHLREIIQYSNINPRFYDDIPKLRYLPPTVGETITGWLKGHLTEAEALPMLVHAGMDPANAQWLHDSAGRPLGLEEVLHLWNRQVVDEAFVDQAIRQSDVNDAYIDAAKALRHYFPPPRSIVPMLRSGAITEAQANTLLGYYGVDAEWSAAFIAEAKHTSSTTVKELSSSQVTRMYVAQLIDRGQATARLTALKYPPADVTLLLDFADDARHEQLVNATIRKVGTLYVGHKLAKVDAAKSLNDALVPVAAQHDLFTLWDIERAAAVHVPTVAGVIGAYYRGFLTPLETKTRLTHLGVQPDDLALFVVNGWPARLADIGALAAQAVVNA